MGDFIGLGYMQGDDFQREVDLVWEIKGLISVGSPLDLHAYIAQLNNLNIYILLYIYMGPKVYIHNVAYTFGA